LDLDYHHRRVVKRLMIKTAKRPSIKSPRQIESMRRACRITARAMQKTLAALEVGMTTADLDDIIHSEILNLGGKPAFLGLYGFPNAACISLNEEIVHGIPSATRVVCDGDLVSIDCGSIVDGMYSDMARTVIAGAATAEKLNLLQSTEEALICGTNEVAPGKRVGDISQAVERRLSADGYGIVRKYVGHGVGAELHEPPEIPNFADPYSENLLMIGMALAIEPMATIGSEETEVLRDSWTVATKDRSLSAHYEDTVLVTEDGFEVLTRI